MLEDNNLRSSGTFFSSFFFHFHTQRIVMDVARFSFKVKKPREISGSLSMDSFLFFNFSSYLSIYISHRSLVFSFGFVLKL